MQYDLVVLGGGIIGLASAWTLSEKGLKVALVERDSLNSGTSHICGGMLAPNAEASFTEPDLLSASRQSLALWKDFRENLESVSGQNIGYRSEGTLMIALERDDVLKLEHAKKQHDALGLKTQILSADAAREREANLSPRVLRALFCGDHQVDPPLVMDALSKACKISGVDFFEHAGEPEIEDHCLRFQDKEIKYASLLICTGARRVKRKDAPVIKPIKGQMVVLDMPTPLCEHVIRAPDAYIVPKASRLLIGATMEEMGFQDGNRAGSVMDLLVGAWEAMPAIYDLDIETLATGFRPVAPTSMPILKQSEYEKHVFYATGHGRNGVLLTPWTAKYISELVLKSL